MWDRIEPLMPADPVRGRRWADHRRTLEAIAWNYRTNSFWTDLPDELGSFQTAHRRLIGQAVDGTRQMVLAAVPDLPVSFDAAPHLDNAHPTPTSQPTDELRPTGRTCISCDRYAGQEFGRMSAPYVVR
ncbi:hypothetical protein AS594_01895 [Streptomyces agglomeratus]|uniref:Insertion element IS402-like domain-containing protein n=1 Tax=Streptomyces agglomeratus TaxID=285458 RepID=A0A1E5P1K2_9ACTN|nr:hypothetical protein AS594_01895 [Streptomyces agglomeratus]